MLPDDPPHRCTSYSVATARDTGGGTTITYTLAQADIPCSINTLSSATQREYGQDQVTVTHCVGVLAAYLTTPITRGMKLVDDRGSTYRVEGIRLGRAYGGISQLFYADCVEIL
jgi:hypothetical protein